MTTRVAIIGGGPAGAVAALELARAGAAVIVIERGIRDGWKIGEGLPPAAKTILQRLRVWEQFLADKHLISYGNCSAWGSNELVDHSFVFNPHGSGWHLNRKRFDETLLGEAIGAGADFLPDAAIDCKQTEMGWELGFKELPPIVCDFVIDASGRSSWFARRQGANRINHDNLVAAVALMNSNGETADQDSLTWVEAIAEGWWYSALLPQRRLVVAFLCDADLDAMRMARTADGWKSLLEQTLYLRERVERHGYRIEIEPKIVSANSSRLDVWTGKSWLATGDAAAAFDPLSSQGIITAMESGIWAAEAILNGQPEALNLYSKRLEQIFTTYLANKEFYYAQERRWPDSPFWLRRRPPLIDRRLQGNAVSINHPPQPLTLENQ